MIFFSHIRSSVRDRFFAFLRKVLRHESGREAVLECLEGTLHSNREAVAELTHQPTPYDGVGQVSTSTQTCERSDIIFLTGRFRSGSTLLWNIFRQLDGTTSYYEPFNERRWFDPNSRGERVDGTHRRVTDYWREYDQLEDLNEFYNEDWIRRRLFMDANDFDAEMKKYLERLIERSDGRPVLQFNRLDFRLPWLCHNFPNARVVHNYRHPRDQWCSALMDTSCFGPESGGLKDFASADKFYLRSWVNDLKVRFPFLADESLHPYRHFYWLWKLSYLFGTKYSDHSICFEELVANPEKELKSLLNVLEIPIGENIEQLKSIIEKPDIGKWGKYADGDWFAEHEAECEQVLSDFLRKRSS